MEQTIGQPVGQTGILRTLNIKKMIKRLLLTSTLLASSALAIQAQDLFLSEGQYYTDESQTTPYTGRYTEFYDDGMLKMEKSVLTITAFFMENGVLITKPGN